MTVDIEALERFVGNYSVESRAPDGKAYRGTMTVVRRGAFLHTESKLDAPLGVRYGLAMPFAGRLVMAFGVKDKVEIGAYQIDGKNVVGMWVPPGAADADFAKCGREESVVESPGVFRITKAYAVDQSAYSGTVRLTPFDKTRGLPSAANGASTPTPVQMTWSLHDGEYKSFGIAYPNAVYSTFNLAQGQPHGIAVYEDAGEALDGIYLTEAGSNLGKESIRRS